MNSRRENTKKAAAESFRSGLRFFRYTIITAVTLILLFSLYYFREDINIDNVRRALKAIDISFKSGGSAAQTIALDSSEKLAVFPFKNSIAAVSNGSVKVYDRSGAQFMNQGLTLENPAASAGKNRILIYDRGGKNLYVADSFSVVFKKEFTNDIISAKMNETGAFSVVTQEPGYKANVTVFGANCKEKYKINFSDRYVMDVAISPDSSSAAVLLISESGGSIVSTVEFYSFNKDTPTASLYYKDDTVLRIDYRPNGRLLAIAADYIAVIDKKGIETAKISIDEGQMLSFSDASENYFAVLSGYGNETGEKLRLYDNNGKNVGETTLEEPASKLNICGKYIGILYKNKVCVLAPDSLKYIKEFSDIDGAGNIFFTIDNVPCIANNGAVRFLDMD